jgi:hypothetical protein
VITIADPRDHDAAIWALTMGGIRSAILVGHPLGGEVACRGFLASG